MDWGLASSCCVSVVLLFSVIFCSYCDMLKEQATPLTPLHSLFSSTHQCTDRDLQSLASNTPVYSIMTDDYNESAVHHCADGNVWARTGCILSYSGSNVDIAINYALLATNLVWCIIALSLHTRDIKRSTALRTFALAALVFGTEITSRCMSALPCNESIDMGTRLPSAFVRS